MTHELDACAIHKIYTGWAQEKAHVSTTLMGVARLKPWSKNVTTSPIVFLAIITGSDDYVKTEESL